MKYSNCLLLPLFYMSYSSDSIFEKIKKLHVAIIGDVMLDNYYSGKVERMSPEAPVPIVNIYKKESRLGGAANVALNCISLGAKATLISVIGDDEDGKTLLKRLQENNIATEFVRVSKERITTNKTRILSRNQQMMRLDSETTEELNTKDEHALIDATLRFLQIQKPDILIFQDYNKGVLKTNVIEKLIQHCKNLNIPIAVDPKKVNFFAYKGVDIFKPNLKEVQDGLHIRVNEVNETTLDNIHTTLQNELQHKISFITLSEKGVYYHNDSTSEIISSHVRNIADVSGAGDTVIAVASLVYVATKDASLMAAYSNIAGGLVCEVPGVCPVNKELFHKEIIKLLS